MDFVEVDGAMLSQYRVLIVPKKRAAPPISKRRKSKLPATSASPPPPAKAVEPEPGPPSSPSQATTASTEPAESPPQSPAREPAVEPPLPALGEALDDVREDRAALCEMVDVEGILEAKRQIRELEDLMGQADTRVCFLNAYVQALFRHYSPPTEGPNGLAVCFQNCNYRSKYGMSGRVYTMGHDDREAPEWAPGQRSSIDVAGMPRELKPLLLGRLGRDLDLVNAQPTLLSQLARTLTWADGRAPPKTGALEKLATDRAACIAEVAEVHAIEGSYEYVKDVVKPLFIAACFGGTYRAWRERAGLTEAQACALSPFAVRFEREMAELRQAVFASDQWCEWVERDIQRQQRAGKKQLHEIERSVMARIAQSEENRVLTSMRRHCAAKGLKTLSLVYDGMVVLAEGEGAEGLDLRGMEARIATETGYCMRVEEKPLYIGPGGALPRMVVRDVWA
jgi:hypothetical protein